MAAITVRNLSDETHRGLRLRAAQHGRSTEAEVRAILDAAVRPAEPINLADALLAIGRDVGGLEIDIPRDEPALRPSLFDWS